jgi:hypothetical protein
MPQAAQGDFDAQLQSFLALSYPTQKNGNNHAHIAMQGKILQVHGFCLWHREQALLDKINQSGFNWPATISQKLLPGRIQGLLPVLIKLASDPQDSVVFQAVESLWRQKGRVHCLSNQGKWEASQLFGLG